MGLFPPTPLSVGYANAFRECRQQPCFHPTPSEALWCGASRELAKKTKLKLKTIKQIIQTTAQLQQQNQLQLNELGNRMHQLTMRIDSFIFESQTARLRERSEQQDREAAEHNDQMNEAMQRADQHWKQVEIERAEFRAAFEEKLEVLRQKLKSQEP